MDRAGRRARDERCDPRARLAGSRAATDKARRAGRQRRARRTRARRRHLRHHVDAALARRYRSRGRDRSGRAVRSRLGSRRRIDPRDRRAATADESRLDRRARPRRSRSRREVPRSPARAARSNVIRALIMLVLFATVAHAQPPGQTPPRGPAQRAPAQDKREAVKKKIRAMRAFTLTDELGLDEKAASKLFPILSRWDDVTDKLLQQRVDIQRRLTSATDPKALDKVIDEAVANQKAFWDLEDKRLA